MDSKLAASLRAALGAKVAAQAAHGETYVPRTRHLVGGAAKYTNRLILESSPYLLQHAHNPVDWHPFGDEAFKEAERRGVPVFLSVGYSTCHWCHVMEEESFEDDEIAAFMNRHYVCIKVDREDRPDVDAVYMSAVQALTGSGGWPMSVWLTPAREPFFGGTYFPPRDGVRGARQGFLTVLEKLAASYASNRDEVRQQASALSAAVRKDLAGGDDAPASAGLPGTEVIREAVAALGRGFDDEHGGLRRAPKFPSNLPVRLLLRAYRRTGDAEALRMATVTLDAMAAGGIHDQIGGGFHRYSTDARWLVPHFEKMLYDNALLATAYVEAYQVTGREAYARVARRTLDYLVREMKAALDGFTAATDADSARPDGKREEGAFFVWSEAEIRTVLGGDADRFIHYYGVTAAGNFEGSNILFVPRPDEAQERALESARARLYQARARRPPPARDDKIIAAWNGLAISAFALAGRVLTEPRYLEAAANAANFVLQHMLLPGGRLARSFRDHQLGPPGYLEDYAFVTAGLFDLFEADPDPRWLKNALAMTREPEGLFEDKARGGWFAAEVRPGRDELIARERPQLDGATPSGTSVQILNLLRAATFTGNDNYRIAADRALASLRVGARPLAMTEALLALDYRTDEVREIAIVRPEGAPTAAAEPLLAVVRRTFVPNQALATGADSDLARIADDAHVFEGKHALAGRPTAYVCEHGRCELPTSDPEVLARQLTKTRGY